MTFDKQILYNWKQQFIFSNSDKDNLSNIDVLISDNDKKNIFIDSYDLNRQIMFFKHILYSNISLDQYYVSYDSCATNIINKLFDTYVTENTLIITSFNEHPSVLNNLNKFNSNNIVYINNISTIFNLNFQQYSNIFIYICATPAYGTNIIPNSIIKKLQKKIYTYNNNIITVLDDVQGFFLYPRDYSIYDYIIGTAHAIIPNFNLGYVISKRNNKQIFNLYSAYYEIKFINALNSIFKYKHLLYQYSTILSQYYYELTTNKKFRLYNEVPFKFYIIDQEKIDYEKQYNNTQSVPTYLIGTTDINDNTQRYVELNKWYKEIALKNNKLYYSTGLLRATLSILDFDDFLSIIDKLNMLINLKLNI